MTRISLPTSTSDWRLMGRTVRLVLSIPSYAAVAVFAGAVALAGIVASQNLTLVADVVVGGALPLVARIETFLLLFPFLGPAFDALRGFVVIVTALLVSVNVALLVYHLWEHDLSVRSGSGSLAGVFFATLGAGCAACGPVVFAGLFALFGGSGLLLLLPLEGLEFALVAIVLLILSTYWLADGMRGGNIAGCPVTV